MINYIKTFLPPERCTNLKFGVIILSMFTVIISDSWEVWLMLYFDRLLCPSAFHLAPVTRRARKSYTLLSNQLSPILCLTWKSIML